LKLPEGQPVVALLDHDTGDRIGDRDLLDALCAALKRQQLGCIGLLARWGPASVESLATLTQRLAPTRPVAVVTLQDFVIGGGEGREAATQAIDKLDVPVFKGIRLTDRSASQWRLSEDGLPWDSVHYRLAMPELQGISQPSVLAAATAPQLHSSTGLEITSTRPLQEQVTKLAGRIKRWHTLQAKPNFAKRLAIIYYNHPPGRHNVGADNLDIPASLWQILHALRQAGYDTGPLPHSPEALLELIQQQGINLPEDRTALATMAPRIATVPTDAYRRWFTTLPETVRRELTAGPLGYLHSAFGKAIAERQPELARGLLERTLGDLGYVLEGADHPARARALDLLEQLEREYRKLLAGDGDRQRAQSLYRALAATGIEGLGGWGEPPGRVMVHKGRLLVPGLVFGKIFIGPQPPRGWELNEELLHANLAFPPPHQYLAFYRWLKADFRADALIHLGRHSTYEFLPRRRAGLTGDDYPALVAGDLPGIYPYIVDGVGEGLQAKRRGLAVMVDHLTPPLKATPLYDDLLALRQLVESFEAAAPGPARTRAVTDIRTMVRELELGAELKAGMARELAVRGIGFEQLDDELLVHEVGHYLTQLQEKFMPLGLHAFGRDWSEEAVKTMLDSMTSQEATVETDLRQSPQAEMTALLAALEGRFVPPGKGNDPLRTPEAL
ncbi:MAG: cobaltochelatase subunit CobN, partial [Candidatus Competibacteraceae bacterium]|nr:cobaltochelatase subunit CobN [Candidatus Competibacteraceae bacterium]